MVDCTNADNLDNFLDDLRISISLAHEISAISRLLTESKQPFESKGFVWIDDGKNVSQITISSDEKK